MSTGKLNSDWTAGRRLQLTTLALFCALWLAGCTSEPTQVFSDDAVAAGLVFRHDNGMTGELYFAENVGAGVALFDYDNDGDLDVYLVQGHRLDPAIITVPTADGDRLFRNDLHTDERGHRALTFTDVTAETGVEAPGYGMGVAAGDIDNDGDVDLYVTNLGSNQLWINQGDGTFRDVAAARGVDDPHWSTSVMLADVTGDGWLDLYVANYVDYRLVTDRPCLTATGTRTYCSPQGYRPSPDRFFRGTGGGHFEDVTVVSGIRRALGKGLGVASGDFNADGRTDIYVANDLMPNQLWINVGDARFEDQAAMAGTAVNAEGIAEASMGIVFEDLDNDADEDLFVTHLTGETNTLYRGEGLGFFDDVTPSSRLGAASLGRTGFGVEALDFDNDGRLDLFVANGAVQLIDEQLRAGDPHPLRQANQLFRNVGSGVFEDLSSTVAALAEPSVSRGAAAGDLDNDGDQDLVVQNNNGPVSLLVNRLGQDQSWLGVIAFPSNAAAGLSGTTFTVDTAAGPQLRRLRTDGSYCSSGDPRAQFGGVVAGANDLLTLETRHRRLAGLAPGSYHVLPRRAP